jgi:hypothetical protein
MNVTGLPVRDTAGGSSGGSSLPDSAGKRGSIFAIGGREARLDKPDVLARFVSCRRRGCAARGAVHGIARAGHARPEYDSAFGRWALRRSRTFTRRPVRMPLIRGAGCH